ncbi:unnamed protein product [Strongylus vulgaris]|uniref:SHSP domain-containing protein n=1 Tax=Strongylus vulgaris TaxID=40348 RepID=A0A3P7ITZ7_STRVU|nr:unnamed protein product [Strongylus vulgaris]
MTLWRRPRSPDWTELDQRFDEMSRRIDRALDECRRDMRRFEESFFPSAKYGEAQKVMSFVRTWRLPDEADIDAIRSTLSDSGRLSVEVPKFPSAHVNKRSIPVTYTKTDKRETNIH